MRDDYITRNSPKNPQKGWRFFNSGILKNMVSLHAPSVHANGCIHSKFKLNCYYWSCSGFENDGGIKGARTDDGRLV